MSRRLSTLFLVALLSSCGGNLTESAQKTLSTTLEATNHARNGFVRWDEAHQLAIVEASTTREQAESELLAYREKRRRVVVAFSVAYGSIAAAASIIPLVEAQKKSPGDLVLLLSKSAEAIETALSAYSDLQEASELPTPAPETSPDRPPNSEPANAPAAPEFPPES